MTEERKLAREEYPLNMEKSKPNTGPEPGKQPNNLTPEPSAVAQPQAKPSPHGYKITCDKKRDWVDKATLGMEGFGLFVLIVYTIATIVYACITHNMWKETQEQTRIQRKTAINSERAWVGLDIPITLDAIGIRSNQLLIKGHYSLKNFGHGPALKVVQSGMFVDTNESMEIQGREADFFCDSSMKFATGTVPMQAPLKQPAPFGHTLFPGQPDNYPIENQGPIETAKFFRFIGCVAYLDQFKTVHWTRFCMERRPGDSAQVPKLDFCAMYNDTDQPNEQ
jgi:hypothetical protein